MRESEGEWERQWKVEGRTEGRQGGSSQLTGTSQDSVSIPPLFLATSSYTPRSAAVTMVIVRVTLIPSPSGADELVILESASERGLPFLLHSMEGVGSPVTTADRL